MLARPFSKSLIPVIKLAEPITHAPMKEAHCKKVVVKLQDLLSKNGKAFNSRFNSIVAAGGLHNFLGFEGEIILSTIMRDYAIFGCTSSTYVDAVNLLGPDCYFTPDGETYEGERFTSQSEINRVLEETNEVIRNCPGSRPIGLVKGSNAWQVTNHALVLREFGVRQFALHAGDFLCRGNEQAIFRALQYGKLIKQNVPSLLLYGVGSLRHFRKFFFADAFVTQSHFVQAFNGKRFDGVRWKHFNGNPTGEIVLNNFRNIEQSLEELSLNSGGLKKWVAETEVAESRTLQEEAAQRML